MRSPHCTNAKALTWESIGTETHDSDSHFGDLSEAGMSLLTPKLRFTRRVSQRSGCKRGLGGLLRLPQHRCDRAVAAFLGPLFRRRTKS